MSRAQDLHRASRNKLRRMYYAFCREYGRTPHDEPGIEAKARSLVQERHALADLEWQLQRCEREGAAV